MQDWFCVPVDRLEDLPDDPGVYRFLNCKGEILYIGKSVHLRRRVRSYLRRDGGHSRQTERLKFEARSVEVLPTGSELAALLLEGQLIRYHLPPFNQAQKRYRQYPFLRLSIQEEFPRLHLTRVLAGDGAEYYGPYTQAGFVQWIAQLLSAALGIRGCEDLSAVHHGCLLDQLGKCLGPCRDKSIRLEYRLRVGQLRSLLRGEELPGVMDQFEERMLQAAEREEFEQAIVWRDRAQALKSFFTHQAQVRERVTLDAVAVQPGPARTVQVFWIQQGKLTARQNFQADSSDAETRQVVEQMCKAYYSQTREVEPVFTHQPQDLDEIQLVSSWLYRHRQDADLLWLSECNPEQVPSLVLTQIRAAHRRF